MTQREVIMPKAAVLSSGTTRRSVVASHADASDQNPGTEQAQFATIGHAASFVHELGSVPAQPPGHPLPARP